jgi:hypothetical protein
MKRESIPFLTERYLSAPAPGIACLDRERRALVAACEAVDADIERQGAVSYEAVELVRAALALARRQS